MLLKLPAGPSKQNKNRAERKRVTCYFDLQTAPIKRTNENSDWMSQGWRKWHWHLLNLGILKSLQTGHLVVLLCRGNTMLNNG